MNRYVVEWSARTFFGGTYAGTRKIYAENEDEAADRARRSVKREVFPDTPVRIETVKRIHT